ncbi:MAG: hypothetical protein A3F54_04215 [Candidatus Kerfeldbacteria bacterium RIFCSPHIGHO2_12_FULL_48_17]|uniref:Uncharacterized protein n=1 Tax=Candidatus Kerfeldbacteria bacterium RIFCSPHIGHO2_12_FULL_48_17 TaxID=1798542 RepID=A0A1G2B6Z5_9BACT|nr:MAG: hypothetical protein A3F54_04215 [Candidatus Kerfeldbacteria bacterium RIFCSPHIGHO2_12_FULL_48_17]
MRKRAFLSLGLGLFFGLIFFLPHKTSAETTLGVTPAGYDDMGAVLTSMGFSADVIAETDLADLDTLKKYSALYLNCSDAIDAVIDSAAPVLRQYVEEGGVVYASDYTEGLISAAFPGQISFYQGESILGGASSARMGNMGTLSAKVTDAGLGATIGRGRVDITFDLPNWVVMTGTAGRVYMRGPAPIIDFSKAMENFDLSQLDLSNPENLDDLNITFPTGETLEDVPYVVSFEAGEGEVLYTSFHDEAQVSADVSQILNWFATRAQAAELAETARGLSGENEDALVEIVDSIQKGEAQAYTFTATGDGDFDVVLNFGGSALDLKITDPKGKVVTEESVSQPPFTYTVTDAMSGKYILEVFGRDVPTANYPFVLTVLGEPAAAGTQDSATVAASTPSSAGAKNTTYKDWLKNYKIVVPVVAGIIVVIVIVGVMMKKKNSTPNIRKNKKV